MNCHQSSYKKMPKATAINIIDFNINHLLTQQLCRNHPKPIQPLNHPQNPTPPKPQPLNPSAEIRLVTPGHPTWRLAQ